MPISSSGRLARNTCGNYHKKTRSTNTVSSTSVSDCVMSISVRNAVSDMLSIRQPSLHAMSRCC